MGTGIADLPLIAVDQEGGVVNRLRLHDAPSAFQIGTMGDTAKATEVATRYARECRDRGIAVVFAPVLDIREPGANSVIGTRSFGEDSALVSAMGLAFARGLMAGGVIPVAKHFPGHGATKEDSHTQLAILNKDLVEIEYTLFPFKRAAELGIPGIMVGHIACPALEEADSEYRPASISPVVINGYLRDTLKFENVIITDDLNMKGIGKESLPVTALQALQAGNDAVIIALPSPKSVYGVCEEVSNAVQEGRLTHLSESKRRLDAWRSWLQMAILPNSSTTIDQEKIRLDEELSALSTVATNSEMVETAPAALNAEEVEKSRTSSLPKNGIEVNEVCESSENGGSPREVIVHRVKAGDTLYGIAAKYDADVDDIKKRNKIKGDKILSGEDLQIAVRSELAN